MPYLVLKKKGEAVWVTYIKKRIKLNKNFLGFVSGETGSSKSYSCLSIAEQLDLEFNINRVVFSALDVMELINAKKKDGKDLIHSGSVIVFDEMGIDQSHRTWQSTTNRLLNYLIQTFRHRNIIFLMNSPYLDFVDASTRRMFHAEFKTQKINYKKKEAILKPHFIEYNPDLRKFYRSRIFVMEKGREGATQLDLWRVKLPSKELYEAYEEKKNNFTSKLNKRIMDGLRRVKLNEERQLSAPMMICDGCSHRWQIKTANIPKQCPKCRSRKIYEEKTRGEY